jgi:hypothetical protein
MSTKENIKGDSGLANNLAKILASAFLSPSLGSLKVISGGITEMG